MDTVLDVGLNLEIATALAQRSSRPRHAWDCYRRLISMYGDVVDGVPKSAFENAITVAKAARNCKSDVELDADAMRDLCTAFAAVYTGHTGRPFPTDPWSMLRAAIQGVVCSWDNPRAVKYRALNRLTNLRGTAVTIQVCIFCRFDCVAQYACDCLR